MTSRIGILGIGETDYQHVDERSLEELVHSASRAALTDAGIGREEIDNVVVCASDLEDGRAISSMVTAGPAGSYRRDFIKTTDSGVHALGLAAMRMNAGAFGTTLVVSWGKQSETPLETIRQLEADPFYHRGIGLGYATGHAVTVSAYADQHDDADKAAARIVEKNTQNGADSSTGQRTDAVDASAVSDSPVVSWPLREAHLPATSDGACAMVMATQDTIGDQTDSPVWLKGVGWETASYNVGRRPQRGMSALEGAASRAYDEADIDPSTEIDLAEVHSPSAYHELLACNALGICDASAREHALNGDFDRDGMVSVNPSGGPFVANPLIATGLARVAAAAKQLRSDAGDVQVNGARQAVAHSTAGFTDQVHGVAVLGGGQS